MVNNIKENFQKHLIYKVYKSNNQNTVELLIESSEIMNKRTKVNNRFYASNRALELMREIEQICNEAD